MGPVEETTFDGLVEQFLGEKLPEYLSGTITFSQLPSDTQLYILRLLFLMKRSGYSAFNFSPVLIWWLSSIIPNMLPSTWGGQIPPITLPGRHKKFDDYVANMDWVSGKTKSLFLDVGCGFPPVTSADTARRFPNWNIIGIDQSFSEYVLYDKDGHYACFDQKGEFKYFQAAAGSRGPVLAIDHVKTKKRFLELFSVLSPLMPKSDGPGSKTVEKNGNKLIYHHICDFEKPNLKFIKSSVINLKLPPAKVCRIMNMLIYFKPDIRKKILNQAAEHLDGGVIISGTNGFGSQSRYFVHKKDKNRLLPDEFAFSLDNLGHLAIMPWFTIVENDPEALLLADLSRIIRRDNSFWPEFSKRLDQLLKRQELCCRDTDGYLKFPKEVMPADTYFEKTVKIWQQMEMEGYTMGAVDALLQGGYTAWKNSVGDIAVKPFQG